MGHLYHGYVSHNQRVDKGHHQKPSPNKAPNKGHRRSHAPCTAAATDAVHVAIDLGDPGWVQPEKPENH